MQPVQIAETYHKGHLPQIYQGIGISADNVIAAVFKKAEDRDGFILRCYETAGRDVDTTIEIPVLNRKWAARFSRCEIKTFLIPRDRKKEITETNLIEF